MLRSEPLIRKSLGRFLDKHLQALEWSFVWIQCSAQKDTKLPEDSLAISMMRQSRGNRPYENNYMIKDDGIAWYGYHRKKIK